MYSLKAVNDENNIEEARQIGRQLEEIRDHIKSELEEV